MKTSCELRGDVGDVEVSLFVGDVAAEAAVGVYAGADVERRGARRVVIGFHEHVARVGVVADRRDLHVREIGRRLQSVLGVLQLAGVIQLSRHDAQLTEHDFVLRFRVFAHQDSSDVIRLAFGDVVNQIDLAGLGVEDFLDRAFGVARVADLKVRRIDRLRLVDESKRAVRADHFANVALKNIRIVRLTFGELQVCAELRIRQGVVAVKDQLIDVIALALIDDEVDLQFRIVRRPD